MIILRLKIWFQLRSTTELPRDEGSVTGAHHYSLSENSPFRQSKEHCRRLVLPCLDPRGIRGRQITNTMNFIDTSNQYILSINLLPLPPSSSSPPHARTWACALHPTCRLRKHHASQEAPESPLALFLALSRSAKNTHKSNTRRCSPLLCTLLALASPTPSTPPWGCSTACQFLQLSSSSFTSHFLVSSVHHL